MQTVETDIDAARQAIGTWAEEQFGEEQPGHFPLYGGVEEMGELTTSILKIAQGIDDNEKYKDRVGDEAERDAIGDVFIYLMDFAHRAGIPTSRIDMSSPVITREDVERNTEIMGLSPIGISAGFHLFWAYSDLSLHYAHGKDMGVPDLQRVLDTLRIICDIRGHSFDRAISETMDEVLDREWDADVTF